MLSQKQNAIAYHHKKRKQLTFHAGWYRMSVVSDEESIEMKSMEIEAFNPK
jgi:hypothetical protein